MGPVVNPGDNMRTLFLALLVACGSPDTGTDPDPDTDVDTDTETEAAPPLEAGRWFSSITAVENDTCNGVITPTMAPAYDLAWVDDTTFTLDDGGVLQACTIDGDAITCEPYTFPLSSGADYQIGGNVPTNSFVIVSPTEFTRVEVLEISCTGGGCEPEMMGMSLPCAMDIVEHYER